MADEIGPVFSALAGIQHEAEGLVVKGPDGKRQPLAEAAMDMANNMEGLRSKIDRRPISPAKIQSRP